MTSETVGQIGEFDLIERIQHLIDQRQNKPPNLILGIGDDAAAWATQPGAAIMTTDTMVEGVHFNTAARWHDTGWKALASNISDIAAMGGTPRYALITLALPAQTPVSAVEELYRGMLDIAGQYGVALTGGDIVGAREFVVTVALYGEAQLGAGGMPLLMRRDTGRPGDLLAVTNHIGSSAAGLAIVLGQLPVEKLDPAVEQMLLQAHFHPIPRLRESRLIAEAGVHTAMDLSDGLAGDLRRLCASSKTGARINSAQLPILPEVEAAWGKQAIDLALHGGEDYELLVAAPASVMALAGELLRANNATSLTVIGTLTAEPNTITIVDQDGNERPLQRGGWDHFQR